MIVIDILDLPVLVLVLYEYLLRLGYARKIARLDLV